MKICLMAAMLVPIAALSQMTAPRPPLAQRIGHTDLSKVEPAHSHGSVGLRKCQTLVPASAMDVDLNFVFRCQMQPGGGVAEHFHNTVEEIPQFMLMRLDKTLLQPVANYHGGQGTVQYRRALDSDVFETNWAYVDYLLIPPGASEGLHYHTGVEEIYYVMDGSGQVQVNKETEPIHKGDGVPILFREAHSFTNNGSTDLELMIIGISAVKDALDTELGAPHQPGG
jgi:mannose-6-phosphate isomerase-like protein (cupin superfamily)